MSVRSSHLDLVKALWWCANSFFTGSILDFNISVTTATFSVFTPTIQGFSLYAEKKQNPFETAWRSSLPIALVTARRACRLAWTLWPPGLAPLQTMSIAWPHSCTRGARADRFICTQSQRTVASHSNCISVHGGSWGEGGRERSCGAYYCGWGKFSWNGRGDGKSSPLTLIWENNTAPAPTEKRFSRWQSRPACLWQKTVN